jgi:EAL domain-containing protein (putative c-di-GMP-specific phosphodiesterase class I)
MAVYHSDDTPTSPSLAFRERSHGDFGAAFAVACPEVVERFESDGALGLILVDASALLRIEELAGPPAFRRAFDTLTERVRMAAWRVVGESIEVTGGLGDDAQVLVFVHRSRDEGAFYAEILPAGAREMHRLLEGQLRRVGYPYLTEPLQMSIGHSFALWRPFQRPESQLRRLLESAFACAVFERESMRRDRHREFEKILLEKRISCHYEPIVRLKDLTVIGYEGLARGPSGSRLQSPIALFDAAEAVGLDYELDCLCRELALKGARDLPQGAKLFLNCLPASVHDPLFQASEIREALGQFGLSPADLVLEISERQAITSYAVFRDAIATFAELGFGIAVDDMGAGYSSLATALELRPGFLKIDRSLITGIDGDPPRQELMRAMQGLAERTTAIVVAEGIESEVELEVLLELGIDCGQGFVFGRGSSKPVWFGQIHPDGHEQAPTDASPSLRPVPVGKAITRSELRQPEPRPQAEPAPTLVEAPTTDPTAEATPATGSESATPTESATESDTESSTEPTAVTQPQLDAAEAEEPGLGEDQESDATLGRLRRWLRLPTARSREDSNNEPPASATEESSD